MCQSSLIIGATIKAFRLSAQNVEAHANIVRKKLDEIELSVFDNDVCSERVISILSQFRHGGVYYLLDEANTVGALVIIIYPTPENLDWLIENSPLTVHDFPSELLKDCQKETKIMWLDLVWAGSAQAGFESLLLVRKVLSSATVRSVYTCPVSASGTQIAKRIGFAPVASNNNVWRLKIDNEKN